MNSKDLARILRAFGELAEFKRSNEFYSFAQFIEEGRSESAILRFKRFGRSSRHPGSLRRGIETIETGLRAAGAKKQAAVIAELLKSFRGPEGSTLDDFLNELRFEPVRSFFPPRQHAADIHNAVQRIVADLKEPTLGDAALEEITARLSSPALTGTSTLAMIARSVLGNGQAYRDRKTTIQAIIKRHRAIAMRNARQPDSHVGPHNPANGSKCSS